METWLIQELCDQVSLWKRDEAAEAALWWGWVLKYSNEDMAILRLGLRGLYYLGHDVLQVAYTLVNSSCAFKSRLPLSKPHVNLAALSLLRRAPCPPPCMRTAS